MFARRVILPIVGVVFAACPAPPPNAPVATPAPSTPKTDMSDAGVDGASGVDAAAAIELAPVDAWNSGRRKQPDRAGDLCQPADENIERAERELVDARHDGVAAVAATPWDKQREPAYLSKIERRFALTRAETAMLAKNGFFVSQRLETPSYAQAFHEIYQSELPIYVSVDSIFHAVFKANDRLIELAEADLSERLGRVVSKLRATLQSEKHAYPDEVAKDVDLYLDVADSLLSGEGRPSLFGSDAEARELVAKATSSTGGLEELSLFGRPRMIDFSQYQVRGHYTHSEELGRYFRGAMWLSRLEFNLVSRASRSSQPGVVPNPDETPREAVDALALADLAKKAGTLPDLDALEKAWSLLAGRREDVSIRELALLRSQAKIGKLSIPDSADRLRGAIGNRFARTARIHYMPQGSTPLPVIATLLGPRIGADVSALSGLVHADVSGRDVPTSADVAFVLGHDRAKKLLSRELGRYPKLEAKLADARAALAQVKPTDMYSAWLGAIRELSNEPEGRLPSFMHTHAFADLRISSTVAAYGELRHNYVLITGETYSEGGCEIPEGFVEPAPAVYAALGSYAERGAEAMRVLGIAAGEEHFARLGRVLATLAAISRDELAGRPPSEAAKNYLSMVVEIIPPSSDGPGAFNGWYFDLFPNLEDAFSEPAFVADWFTGSNSGRAVYAGATRPRLGVFVVDVGGAPRAFVGPVARSFEYTGDMSTRAKDADVSKLKGLADPWARSYTPSAPAAPAFGVVTLTPSDDGAPRYALRGSTKARVHIELLGHHRDVLASASVMPNGTIELPAPGSNGDYAELVRVRAGEFSTEFSIWDFLSQHSFGGLSDLPESSLEALKTRAEGHER